MENERNELEKPADIIVTRGATNLPKSCKLSVIFSVLALLIALISLVVATYWKDRSNGVDFDTSFKLWSLESEMKKYGSATFDPANSEGYMRVNSNTGFFFISLDKAEPYLDGIRIYMSIGNPTSATYEDFKLKVTWGKRFSDCEGFEEWSSQLKEKEISFPEKLLPASWNNINFVVSPADVKNFGYLNISVETDKVILLKMNDD